MDPLVSEEETQSAGYTMFNPITFLLEFLATYGWYLVGGGALVLYLLHKLRPKIDSYKQAREDAEYHKDPDKALSRLEAIQRARERQQQALERDSLRVRQEQIEREERKRVENLERLQKYGIAAGGRTLGGAAAGDDYMPLSGGASTSSYRPPKKSKCKGGGCGR